MLEVIGIDKSYGKNKVLKQCSFSAIKGDIIGLVGENGAGKSTLLSILATLQKASAGDIYINKKSIKTNIKEVRKEIGFVPQDIAIWDDFTGNNHHQLAQKYDLSTIAIYKILAEVKNSLPKPQKDLFIDE